MYEVAKFRQKNAKRGFDKVSLFNLAQQAWTNNKFLQFNESKEGRKLDIAGNYQKFRVDQG